MAASASPSFWRTTSNGAVSSRSAKRGWSCAFASASLSAKRRRGRSSSAMVKRSVLMGQLVRLLHGFGVEAFLLPLLRSALPLWYLLPWCSAVIAPSPANRWRQPRYPRLNASQSTCCCCFAARARLYDDLCLPVHRAFLAFAVGAVFHLRLRVLRSRSDLVLRLRVQPRRDIPTGRSARIIDTLCRRKLHLDLSSSYSARRRGSRQKGGCGPATFNLLSASSRFSPEGGCGSATFGSLRL